LPIIKPVYEKVIMTVEIKDKITKKILLKPTKEFIEKEFETT
jgi:hypothetical protein